MCNECLTLIREHFPNNSLSELICDRNSNWAVKGIIDVDYNVFPMSLDTKVLSKIFEDQLTPRFQEVCQENGWTLYEAAFQNQYPDFTIDLNDEDNTRIAIDVKSTYRINDNRLNGMTLGAYSGTSYFVNRDSTKNIRFPYSTYCSHLVLGIIYDRVEIEQNAFQINALEDIDEMVSPVQNMAFFIQPKWAIASRRSGSGNTTNIGCTTVLDEVINGNGPFDSEHEFDEFWMAYHLR
jgi:hypothetical protein